MIVAGNSLFIVPDLCSRRLHHYRKCSQQCGQLSRFRYLPHLKRFFCFVVSIPQRQIQLAPKCPRCLGHDLTRPPIDGIGNCRVKSRFNRQQFGVDLTKHLFAQFWVLVVGFDLCRLLSHGGAADGHRGISLLAISCTDEVCRQLYRLPISTGRLTVVRWIAREAWARFALPCR